MSTESWSLTEEQHPLRRAALCVEFCSLVQPVTVYVLHKWRWTLEAVMTLLWFLFWFSLGCWHSVSMILLKSTVNLLANVKSHAQVLIFSHQHVAMQAVYCYSLDSSSARMHQCCITTWHVVTHCGTQTGSFFQHLPESIWFNGLMHCFSESDCQPCYSLLWWVVPVPAFSASVTEGSYSAQVRLCTGA